jgi:hypothetical protein
MFSTTKNSKYWKFKRVKEVDYIILYYRSSARIARRTSENSLGSGSDSSCELIDVYNRRQRYSFKGDRSSRGF